QTLPASRRSPTAIVPRHASSTPIPSTERSIHNAATARTGSCWRIEASRERRTRKRSRGAGAARGRLSCRRSIDRGYSDVEHLASVFWVLERRARRGARSAPTPGTRSLRTLAGDGQNDRHFANGLAGGRNGRAREAVQGPIDVLHGGLDADRFTCESEV